MKSSLLASVFSQQASPRAWLLAQRLIGGTPDKRRILLNHYRGESRVVEVGCSIGNIARALTNQSNVSYLGLDIDGQAIMFARNWFVDYPSFRFSTETLQDVAVRGERFDLICVTGVLHHVNDALAEQILEGARLVAAEGARLLMFDPIPLRAGDSLVYAGIHKLEQGEFLRSPDTISSMIERAGFVIDERHEVPIGPGLVSRPKIMSMSVVTAHLAQEGSSGQ